MIVGQAPISSHLSLTSQVGAYENHSHKLPAPVTDTFFASQGCLLTKASTTVFINFLNEAKKSLGVDQLAVLFSNFQIEFKIFMEAR